MKCKDALREYHEYMIVEKNYSQHTVAAYQRDISHFLDFVYQTYQIQSIEDVTLQRFLENKIHIKYKLVTSDSLSVDTPRDLEKVKNIIMAREQ